jgi:hypothetical protein
MGNGNQQKNQENKPAAIAEISLSQVLLAPLDAIYKAQIHAARSVLNMILQLGYPHQPVGEDGQPIREDGMPYNQEFYYDAEINGKKQTLKVSMPALALVPVAPLAVESATFKLEMRVESLQKHNQIQTSEKKAVQEERVSGFDHNKRPWFLVTEPISIRGNLAPSGVEGENSAAKGTSIQIEVKVGKMSMPAGLNKLLTFMTESGYSTKGGETMRQA